MNRKWWVSEPGAELQRRDPPLCSEWEHHRPQRQHSALRQWRPSCAAGYFTRLWRHLQADTGWRTFIVAANGGRLTCLGGQWGKWDKPPRRAVTSGGTCHDITSINCVLVQLPCFLTNCPAWHQLPFLLNNFAAHFITFEENCSFVGVKLTSKKKKK